MLSSISPLPPFSKNNNPLFTDKNQNLKTPCNTSPFGYVLEAQIQFLLEKRTEPYQSTVTGVSQRKIGYETKSDGGSLAPPENRPSRYVDQKKKGEWDILSFFTTRRVQDARCWLR